jgi:hypothetical protein
MRRCARCVPQRSRRPDARCRPAFDLIRRAAANRLEGVAAVGRCARRSSAGYFVTMRRVAVVVGVCALAVAWTTVAAGGSAARGVHHTARRRSELTADLAGLKGDLARFLAIGHPQMILPASGLIRRPAMPSDGGMICFVSSARQACSLVPCKGFVAAGGGPDWVPITPACGTHRLLGMTGRLVRPLSPSLAGRMSSPSAPKSLRATTP